jgi:hypothetical protein
MSADPVPVYWQTKLEQLKQTLESNNFAVWTAQDLEEARSLFWDTLFPQVAPASVSFGGSKTVVASGLYQELLDRSDIETIDTYDTGISREEMIERRRSSLLTDLYLTGTNAVTQEGHLVNLDGMGNRVAALTFGPRHVLLLIGRNKVVPGLTEAHSRIKDYSAPVNTVRLGKKTPCATSMQCEDCSAPERICNTWAITEKSNPPERVKIILINQDLGF